MFLFSEKFPNLLLLNENKKTWFSQKNQVVEIYSFVGVIIPSST